MGALSKFAPKVAPKGREDMTSTKTWFGRATALTALSASVTLAFAGLAYADDIYNNLDGSIDAVAEVMPLNVGTDGTTKLYVDQTNGDGKSGCNFQSDESLVLAVSSSDTAVATVSPSSLTFSSCGDIKTLTVTPVAVGSTTISVSQTRNNTGDSFNLAPATFTVNVSAPAPSNTAPQVLVAGVTGGASYDKGSVPSATCQVTDTEDGNSSFPATLSAITGTYASDGIGAQTASCSYTDGGGLTASASKTYSIVDPSAPVISYTLTPASPDGDNGWYKGAVSLVWNVNDAQSPNSIQKTGCVDQSITADQAATTYTCSATSAGGSAAQQSVTIKRDGTAPAVSYTSASGTEGTHGWYTSDVTATFTGTDALSGPATATKTATTSGEGNAVTVSSPAFTDNAGNTTAAGAASHTVKIDKSAPNAPLASVSPAPNGAGWNNTDVVVSFSGNGDNGPSGVDSCTADVPVSAETAGQTVSGTCTDNAGNVSSARQVTVKLDKTGPSVSYDSIVSGTQGAHGWYTSDVGVKFTATDALSGPATASQTVTSSGEGAAVVVNSPAFSDDAGNTAAAGAASHTVKIDKSAPTNITFTGGPAAGSSPYFGSVPAAPSCTAEDATSGVASCAVTGYNATVGSHTMTATAIDNAGNTRSITRSYSVQAWTAKGFYAPVDMGGVWNTVKGGSTVPLKFELFAGTELTDISAIKSFTTAKVSCITGSAEVDAIELTTTGGTSLRYDSTGGQFIQNWKTPTTLGCYSATMAAGDGSSITALFKILK